MTLYDRIKARIKVITGYASNVENLPQRLQDELEILRGALFEVYGEEEL